MSEHDFYKTGDRDAPEQIKDRNGAVVLQCCRRCGQAEIELEPDCPEAIEDDGPVCFECGAPMPDVGPCACAFV